MYLQDGLERRGYKESGFLNAVAEVVRTGNGFLDYITLNDASLIIVTCFKWPYSVVLVKCVEIHNLYLDASWPLF
jgi:hypothetical protein